MLKKYGVKAIAIVAILFFTAVLAYTHSGGLDQNGGHWDRKKGTYHYHRPKARSTTTTPSRARTPSTVTTPKPSILMSEGSKPYTPTRLEWLALDLNAGIPTTSIRYYTTSKDNTISVCVFYDSTMTIKQRQEFMDFGKKAIRNEANIRGWTWLKLEENYQKAK